jgi:hypothetical protein
MNLMLTYDLRRADEEMHEKAMKLLLDAGFVRTLPGGNGQAVALPQTTVVHNTTWTAAKVRDWAWDVFANNSLNPKRIAVLKHGEEPAARG